MRLAAELHLTLADVDRMPMAELQLWHAHISQCWRDKYPIGFTASGF